MSVLASLPSGIQGEICTPNLFLVFRPQNFRLKDENRFRASDVSSAAGPLHHSAAAETRCLSPACSGYSSFASFLQYCCHSTLVCSGDDGHVFKAFDVRLYPGYRSSLLLDSTHLGICHSPILRETPKR